MQLLYIHGLDSNANAEKGKLLEQFCAVHFPHINVVRPDLNVAPAEAMARLQAIIAADPDTGLVGSSLGGFYATLASNLTGKRAVLINPSTHVGESLKRFFPDNFANLPADYVGHTTPDGWAITKAHIEWLIDHRPKRATFADKILLLVKTGDELLDYREAVEYFSQSAAEQNGQCHIIIEEGGDHRMSDFASKRAQIIQFLFGLPVLSSPANAPTSSHLPTRK